MPPGRYLPLCGLRCSGGPWAAVLAHDKVFASEFVKQDVERYKLIVAGLGRTLYDRDTAPGAEPEDLTRPNIHKLTVPGTARTHATPPARSPGQRIPTAE